MELDADVVVETLGVGRISAIGGVQIVRKRSLLSRMLPGHSERSIVALFGRTITVPLANSMVVLIPGKVCIGPVKRAEKSLVTNEYWSWSTYQSVVTYEVDGFIDEVQKRLLYALSGSHGLFFIDSCSRNSDVF